MDRSRRQFVITGTAVGAAVFAGCLARSPDGRAGDGGDGGTDDTRDHREACDPIELSLTDSPPHEPERPPQPEGIEDEDEWDDHHLGERMDTDSELSFDRINLAFREPIVDGPEFDGESVFFAELLTSRDAFDELVEPVDDESKGRVDGLDFEDEAVVVVLSGFGSSSVRHEWVRVEDHCENAHVHGYYLWPYIQTDDYTSRVSGVVIEKPDEYELERVWVSLTVAEDLRANFHTDADVRIVNGEGDDGDEDDGDEGSDTHGAVDRIQVVGATREFDGDWYSDERDDIGVVVHFDDEDELRAVVDDHEDVDRFVEGTDFGADAVFYLESAGPDACYGGIDVTDIQIVANDDGYFVRGNAVVGVDSDDGGGCAEGVTFPGVVLRVESEVDVREGEFRVTDGWGDGGTIDSISVAELAQE